MGRLRTIRSTAPGERQTIGEQYVHEACVALNHAAQTEAALLVERRYLTPPFIAALFSADSIEKLRAAYMLCEPSSLFQWYSLAPHAPGRVGLNFAKSGMLTPTAKCFQPNEAARPFFDQVRQITEIYHKYSAVKHMLRWFNKNATAGAIRAYWPSVMKLCPNAPAIRELPDGTPARYSEPHGLAPLLPLVRETAVTVAAMALMGERAPNPRENVWLTIDAGTATVAGCLISVDALTFNL